MPFTFSHPAIILPFLKNKKLSATALIVGAMSPDLEYFFRMRIQSEISHTFLGVFLIDLPLGFIIMMLFHEIIKKPLIENAPTYFQVRLNELKNSNWINYAKHNILTVFISFVLGAVSHIFWDSMTHYDGFLVERISFLNFEIYSIPIYKIAQHLSSLIGIFFIFLYVKKLPIEHIPEMKTNFSYWFLGLFFSIIFIGFRFYLGNDLHEIGNAIVSVISCTVLGFALVGGIFRYKKRI